MIRAESIASSVSPQGKRIDTMKLRYPWFIHGELMTHRVFSRNASSNRAIPLVKMLEEVRSDELRAEPVFWGAEQKGMEPGGELTGDLLKYARNGWRNAALRAANEAEWLGKVGLHKSICNRLLMPFTHANVIVTATEWENFFGLRLDKAAEPTMRALAKAMWVAYDGAQPKMLQPEEWHLPFVDDDTYSEIRAFGDRYDDAGNPVSDWTRYISEWTTSIAARVSVARCARVSYEAFETGKRSTVEADLRLYDQLSNNGHWSPFEHQASPDYRKDSPMEPWAHPNEHGNFVGWRQYRKMMQGEAIRSLPDGYVR